MGNISFENFSKPSFVLDFSLSIGLILLVTIFIALKIKRVWCSIMFIILDLLFITTFFLRGIGFDQLQYLPYVSLVFVAVGIVICLNINAGVLRKYFAQSLKSSSTSSKESKTTKMDKETLIQNVCIAVKWLSENRVGALITFEKETPLDDFMRNGTTINCPFTPEIVETIFYEGTRLHDGAIIVRGDTIVAAAVYYTPSTKAILGKFGARHRAGLGISEQTDAVTIIVSEETGRIAITHGGMLDNIKTDEFEKFFRNSIA